MSSSLAQSKSTRKRYKLKDLFKKSFSLSFGSSSGIADHPAPTANVAQLSTLEALQISAKFTQSILPSLAGCVDANPAKTTFNILNVIVDVRKVSGTVPASNWLVPKYGSHSRKSTITRMNCRKFLKRH